MYFHRDQILAARYTDLYAFLLCRHADLFKRVGSCICPRDNQSLYIRSGFHGYRDFSNDETGNSIDFLRRHLGYSFQEAVIALLEFSGPQAGMEQGSTPPDLPPAAMPAERGIRVPVPAPFPHKRMYAFLISRAIPTEMIHALCSQGLVYQEDRTNNVVFLNREKNYCELRGTYTFSDKPFHGCRKSRPDAFWYIRGPKKPKTAFITEAAIDAISLFLIHKKEGRDTSSALYASIGGAANHSTIDRIASHVHSVLAVDKDLAGDICRLRHPDLEHILPDQKDWNEDLQNLSKTKHPTD